MGPDRPAHTPTPPAAEQPAEEGAAEREVPSQGGATASPEPGPRSEPAPGSADGVQGGAPEKGAGDQPAVPQFGFKVTTSRQFTAWLRERAVSIAFTTYQTNRLFLAGRMPDGRVSLFERAFPRAMGLHASSERLWMSSLFQLWRLDNILQPGQVQDGFDRIFMPSIAYTTGDLDIHDIAIDRNGQLVFVNTMFSCLATIADGYSFEPLWKPRFISKLAAEDRCHLNGLAMRDAEPSFVTAVSRSNITDGWRDRRRDGGVLIDVASGEIVVQGLSMPHSPRWHNGRLWMFESGTGYFGSVDLAQGRFEPLTFCPGYLRGLTFVSHFAVVGLSKPRHNSFQGLPLDENLTSRDAEACCGVMVIDLDSGDIVHWLKLEGDVVEMYDVGILPEVHRPSLIGIMTDEIRRVLRMKPVAGDGKPDVHVASASA
ncbi:MAG: TIGR03032 family protein [Geminicoccaceae bacterium]